MKIHPAYLLFLLLVTACQAPTQSPDSGVEGVVTIGPMCPVVQEGIACPDQPYQAELTILTGSGKKVVQFETDEEGSFRIELAAGDYVLHPESPGGPTFSADLPFTVEEHEFTYLEVIYDSGIR